jgi:ABC-2 type transport system permease protein
LGLVAAWAPFQSIIHTPLSVYLGRLDGRELWMALGLQLFWLGVLGVLAHMLWRSSVRALSVQGG